MAETPSQSTPQQALADAYRLDDDAPLIPEATSTPQEASAVGTAAEPVVSKPTPPKDPITGQFVKASEAAPLSANGTAQHPQRLIRLANELGMDETEIAAIPDSATLEQVVHHLNLKSLKDAKANNRERIVSNSVEHNLAQQAKPQPKPAPVEDDPLAAYEFEMEDGEGGTKKLKADEALNPSLTKILRDQAKTIKALQDQVKWLATHEGVRQQETRNQMIDRVFEQSGLPQLGKGRGRDMKPTDAAYQRRLAVLAVVDKIPGDNMEARVKEAIQIIYGEPAPPAVDGDGDGDDDELTLAQRHWREGQLTRPTQRRAPPMKNGKAAATQAVREKLASLGAETNGDVTEDDFLE